MNFYLDFPPSVYQFENSRQFLNGLNSLRRVSPTADTPSGDGVVANGDIFIGILHATQLIPFDSAIFVSTANLPSRTELLHDAAITLLKKRIRVYDSGVMDTVPQKF